MGLDRESTSIMFSIARVNSPSRLLLLPQQKHSPTKHIFTPMSHLRNYAYYLSLNHRKKITLQLTPLNVSDTMNWEKRVVQYSLSPTLFPKQYHLQKITMTWERKLRRGSPPPTPFLTMKNLQSIMAF